MFVKFKKDEESEWQTCLEVAGIRNYIDHKNTFLQMFASTGIRHTISIKLFEFYVYEKQHRLDISDNLAVEHELVNEIFDKLMYFTEELNDNKEELRKIHDIYASTLKKSRFLNLAMRDLFRGTKKFEEHMIRNLHQFEKINPQNLPKMIKIKTTVENLETKQKRIYDRFSSIKGILNARHVFQNMQQTLQKMEGVVVQLNEKIGSDAYQTFFGKTDHVIEFLEKMDFKKMIGEVI